jgi:hypothetical protein
VFVHPHLRELPPREPTEMLAFRHRTSDPEPSPLRQRGYGTFTRQGGYWKSQLASRRWCWGRRSHQPNKACATSGLLLPRRPYIQRPIKSRHILIHLLSQAAQLMLSTLTWLLGSIRAGKTHKMTPPRLRRGQGRWLYSATIVHGAVRGRLSP